MTLIVPTEIQKNIIEAAGNIVVTASAGTGKTFTLVHKIEYEMKSYNGFKTIAAITFTNKAAKEIKDRLKHIDTSNYFIGTNNSFVVEEVIKPFIRDVYGEEYNIKFETDYDRKFNIIAEGLALLRKGIIGTYNETKSNFVFELGLIIVKKSIACSLYLKAKYKKLYIDEYQDSDKDMHNFFMYLIDELGIEAFIVGDEKQSIYTWRNADPKYFISIKDNSNFTYMPLLENHRSCIQIQNYSNLLFKSTRYLYKKIKNLDNIILIEAEKWATKILSFISNKDNIAILRFRNDDAKNCAALLTENGIETMYIPILPISNISCEYSWLCTEICNYCIINPYSVYDVINSAPFENNSSNIKEIKEILYRIKASINNRIIFEKEVNYLFNSYRYNIKKIDIDKMWKSVTETEYFSAYQPEKYKNISMTFHSSKGLEFDQVILFTEDYKLDNWSSYYNHYVASTRAKNKLIIIYDKTNFSSIQFINNLSKTIDPISINEIITDLREQ